MKIIKGWTMLSQNVAMSSNSTIVNRQNSPEKRQIQIIISCFHGKGLYSVIQKLISKKVKENRNGTKETYWFNYFIKKIGLKDFPDRTPQISDNLYGNG
jgi:hypothetical protein